MHSWGIVDVRRLDAFPGTLAQSTPNLTKLIRHFLIVNVGGEGQQVLSRLLVHDKHTCRLAASRRLRLLVCPTEVLGTAIATMINIRSELS